MSEVIHVDTDDIISVTKRLSDIIKQEISLIENMQLSSLHLLYDEKVRLCAILENYKEVLANNPHLLKSMPQSTLNEVRKAVKDFEELLQEDETQIKKARKVHQMVMEAVRQVLNRRAIAASGYNKNGTVEYGKKKIFSLPPVSISESI